MSEKLLSRRELEIFLDTGFTYFVVLMGLFALAMFIFSKDFGLVALFFGGLTFAFKLVSFAVEGGHFNVNERKV